ncbi:hypothetical protein D3C73_547810 [compost metagenome]
MPGATQNRGHGCTQIGDKATEFVVGTLKRQPAGCYAFTLHPVMDLPQQGCLAKAGWCRHQHQPCRQGFQQRLEQVRARNNVAGSVWRLQLGHEQARTRLFVRGVTVRTGHLGHTPHHLMYSSPLMSGHLGSGTHP